MKILFEICVVAMLVGCSKTDDAKIEIEKTSARPAITGLFGERIGEAIKADAKLKSGVYEIEKPLVEIVGFEITSYSAVLDAQEKIKHLSFQAYAPSQHSPEFRAAYEAVLRAIEKKFGKGWGEQHKESTSLFFCDGKCVLQLLYKSRPDSPDWFILSCLRLDDLIEREVALCRERKHQDGESERNLRRLKRNYPAEIVQRILDQYTGADQQKDFL